MSRDCLLASDLVKAKAEMPLPWGFPEPNENGDRIFKIERYGYYGLQISCNGKEILKFEPTYEECSKLTPHGKTYKDFGAWVADVKKIAFDYIYFSGEESYYGKIISKSYNSNTPCSSHLTTLF